MKKPLKIDRRVWGFLSYISDRPNPKGQVWVQIEYPLDWRLPQPAPEFWFGVR